MRTTMRRRVNWIGVPTLLAAIVVWSGGCSDDGDSKASGPSSAPKPMPRTASLVGSETCKECHEDRHETWLGTAHAYALREPDSDSVRGRFDARLQEEELAALGEPVYRVVGLEAFYRARGRR